LNAGPEPPERTGAVRRAWPLRGAGACPARAAAPGEGRRDVPATGSAGAHEAGWSFAERDRSAGRRPGAVESTGRLRTPESRKAEDGPAPGTAEENVAAVGFMDVEPGV